VSGEVFEARFSKRWIRSDSKKKRQKARNNMREREKKRRRVEERNINVRKKINKKQKNRYK
jgi:hypothetical protein